MENRQLRLLAIGAHPDDCEIRVGGLAAKYRGLGHIVKFVSATTGDTGHHKLGGAELAQIRRKETGSACAMFGIESEVLDIHSNGLETDINTREIFIKLIRNFKPDLIITHRLNDYHPDHRRTGMLIQDSSYAIRIPNVCPLTPYLTYSPVILYMYDNFKKPNELSPDVIVDIDDVMESKIRMIDCHKSQVYEWLPWIDGYLNEVPATSEERFKWLSNRQILRDSKVSDRFRARLLEKYGQGHGANVKCSEAFEVSEYGAPLTEEKYSMLFPF